MNDFLQNIDFGASTERRICQHNFELCAQIGIELEFVGICMHEFQLDADLSIPRRSPTNNKRGCFAGIRIEIAAFLVISKKKLFYTPSQKKASSACRPRMSPPTGLGLLFCLLAIIPSSAGALLHVGKLPCRDRDFQVMHCPVTVFWNDG